MQSVSTSGAQWINTIRLILYTTFCKTYYKEVNLNYTWFVKSLRKPAIQNNTLFFVFSLLIYIRYQTNYGTIFIWMIIIINIKKNHPIVMLVNDRMKAMEENYLSYRFYGWQPWPNEFSSRSRKYYRHKNKLLLPFPLHQRIRAWDFYDRKMDVLLLDQPKLNKFLIVK